MEVHESAYLTLCVENRRTFTAGSIVDEYGRMRGAGGRPGSRGLSGETGRLEPFFRDERRTRPPESAGRRPLRRLPRQASGKRTITCSPAGSCTKASTPASTTPSSPGSRPTSRRGGGPSNGTSCGLSWPRSAITAFTANGPRPTSRPVEEGRGPPPEARMLRGRRRASARRGPGGFRRLRAGSWTRPRSLRLGCARSGSRPGAWRISLASFRRDYVRGRPPAEVEGPLGPSSATGRLHRRRRRAIQAAELALRDLEGTWTCGANGRTAAGLFRRRSRTRGRRQKGRGDRLAGPAVDGAAALMKQAAEALERSGRS